MTATVELDWKGSAGATLEVEVASPDQWEYALALAMTHAVRKLGAKDFTNAKVTKIE